jgi:hypothetical protein
VSSSDNQRDLKHGYSLSGRAEMGEASSEEADRNRANVRQNTTRQGHRRSAQSVVAPTPHSFDACAIDAAHAGPFNLRSTVGDA